jgi:16S rRNA (adenine1518-N6/adenine1519-N6)-dimethyltransferase
MSTFRAKKRLGQNFLVDNSIATRIVQALNPQPGDSIVEIGSGQGALTGHLLTTGCFVIAVEFDRDLIPILKAKFGHEKNFTIIAKDFLKINPDELPVKMKLIGNLPYNISTVILERLFEFRPAIINAVFTVQSEVADRLTTPSGNRDYGSLSVIMAAGFDIELLFEIDPESFKPVPEVMSSVIKLNPIDRMPDDFDEFKSFIRACFRQKRKTLNNSMQLGLNLPKNNSMSLINKAGFKKDIRPEQLTFDDYMKLYKTWQNTL